MAEKWFRIEGARASDSDDGATRFEYYEAERGDGLACASRKGVVRGIRQVIDGELYELKGRSASSQPGRDIVELRWVSADAGSGRQDSIPREDGDEEWTFEASLSEVPAEQFKAADGTSWSSSWGDAPIYKQPRGVLVWKKWIDKSLSPATSTRPKNQQKKRPVPISVTDAFSMGACYTSGGSFESSGPQLGYTFSSSATGRKWLCVDIQVDPAGRMMLRTAKFEFLPGGWPETAYPSGSGA